MNDSTEIDGLIDRYLAYEARHRPRIGYPSTAAGTRLFRASRQWETSNSTLSESSAAAELMAMVGAWDSLTSEHDRALRVDALNREVEATVFRVANTTSDQTDALIAAAKARLCRLLADRGVLVCG